MPLSSLISLRNVGAPMTTGTSAFAPAVRSTVSVVLEPGSWQCLVFGRPHLRELQVSI